MHNKEKRTKIKRERIFSFVQYDTVFEKRLHNNPVYHSFKIFTHSYTQANC